MDLSDMLGLIDQAADQRQVREIGLSGGEPFLSRKDLSAVCRRARDHGLSVSVTSNGFWASSDQHARALLSGFREDGLRCLNLSTSPFHLEFIKPERLGIAVRAAHALGLVTRVNVVCTTSFGVEDARHALGEAADLAELVPIPCIPAGRAAEALTPDEFPVRPGIPLGTCAQHFTKLAVTTSGDVFPCCSPGGFTDPLKMGNALSESLEQIIDRMEHSLLLQVLSAFGPVFFVPFVEARLGVTRLGHDFVDQCHLCHTMMSDATMRDIVTQALEQLEADLARLQWDIFALTDYAARGGPAA